MFIIVFVRVFGLWSSREHCCEAEAEGSLRGEVDNDIADARMLK